MKGVIRQVRRLNKNAEWEYSDEFFIDGKQVSEREFRKNFPLKSGIPGGSHPSCWPMASEALAVNPKGIKAARERAIAAGVPTHFQETGEPVFESASHRKKFCEAMRIFDRNGGYSDPLPE